MLGAIIGDIAGTPYEFNNIKTKSFNLFEGSRFSDDSVLTCAIAKALIDSGVTASDIVLKDNVIKQLKYFGKEYEDAGFGFMFQDWVINDKNEPYNSWGNGSAMRVSPAGWIYNSIEETRRIAGITASVTHNHPEGIKGAEATAAVIYLARTGHSKAEIKKYVEKEFYRLDKTCDEIRPDYKFKVSCQGTVPVAITAFLEGQDFEDVLRTAVSLGGDSDTLTCIACGMAEAFYDIPSSILKDAVSFLTDELKDIVNIFYSSYKQNRINSSGETEKIIIKYTKSGEM